MNFRDFIHGHHARPWRWVLLVAGLMVAAGCADKVGVADDAEREQAEMKKARSLEEAGDFRAARNVYEAILDRDHVMARAHLDLAFLLDKTGEDPVAAIYHFRRYLVLRPDTEKRVMIENHIRAETLSLVGTVFTNQVAVLVRMGEMESENRALKIKVSNLQGQTVHLRAALTAARSKYAKSAENASQSVDLIGLPATAPKTAGKLVKVEKADTLKKMAARFYGDARRWREIYEANRQKMKSPGDLKIGQSIFIPERDVDAIP